MRAIPTRDTRLATSLHRTAHWRLLVNDEGSPAQEWDLSDWCGFSWLDSFVIEDTAERLSAGATFTLSREIEQLSLVPGVTGKANRDDDGVAADVLKEARLVVLEVQLVPSGEDANPDGQWHELFRGRIDRIDCGGAESSTITLACRDLLCEEEDTFIEGTSEVENAYPTTPGDDVEEVMQDLITANVVTPRSAKTIYVPTTPGWVPNPFLQAKQPLARALRGLAEQIGWTVKYKWDDGTSAFRLTFFKPDREGGGFVASFSTADFARVESAVRDLASVRNVVKVFYTDATLRSREVHTETDAASVTAHGRRTMLISEASSSNINSATEANTLAEAALADLSQPWWTFTVTLAGLYPYIEIHDAIRLNGDTRWFGSSIDCTVLGIRHVAGPSGDQTVLTCVQQESGTRARQFGPTQWASREGGRGQAPWPSFRADPHCADMLVQKATGQTIPDATKTKVTFDEVFFDRGGNWDDGTDTYVAPFAGLYRLTATVPLEDAPIHEQFNVTLEDGSGNVYAGSGLHIPTANVDSTVGVSAVVFLAAGASVQVYIEHDHGLSYDVPGKGTNPGVAARLLVEGVWFRPSF